MSLTRDAVIAALSSITDPASGKNIVDAGVARAISIDGTTVNFVFEIVPDQATAMAPVKLAAEKAVAALDGVEKVSAVMTAHSAKAPPQLKPTGRPAQPQGPQPVAGVKAIVAIASGKGGVGKSTVSSNLAVALAHAGKRVGLLDADIYGPSQPRMMGVSGPPKSPDGKGMIPPEGHGVKMMSMGLMMREDEAVVWRGPMLMGALQQMLGQVEWGELDVLLIDLPPGTGDVQLSLAQKTELAGAIIVSTPQDIAMLDARKAINMFNKLNTPILGLIENMSTHVCSQCGHEEHLFGHGGVAAEAKKLGVPLLAEVPLGLALREAGDDGTPLVAAEPDAVQSRAFKQAADALIQSGLV
ncbi:MAG TPA: iron-sulfur cluster carrier protein ApbC [Aliiroseovarius sp.]|nr:iron-sulfur cluster carrier protein ApbC [Aliiroseovarius sp.]